MTHSTSGKRGFNLFYKYTNYMIPRDVMMQILTKEDAYRFSEEYQQRYTDCGDDIDAIEAITFDIQSRALADCGITSPEGLTVLHNMRHDYADDTEMLNLAVYARHDHCFKSPTAPANVLIHDLTGAPVQLFDFFRQLDTRANLDNQTHTPVVLVAGSLT